MSRELRSLPLWCVLQADGDRLCPTSRGSVPSQYWSAPGSFSLIQQNLQRALRVAKPRQIIATVAASHRTWWSALLWCVPERRRIVDESSGRPTVTLAMAMALIEQETGKDALVVLQPADTLIANESAFIVGVSQAIETLERLPDHVVALTLEAYKNEPDQDYVLLGAGDAFPGRSAARFVKRPPPIIAERLMSLGAHRSTGVYVARLSTLTRVLAEVWPNLMEAARSLAWTNTGELLAPARMAGSRFYRPWRHTWLQRPLPRLRAVPIDDFGCFSAAQMGSPAPRYLADRIDSDLLPEFLPDSSPVAISSRRQPTEKEEVAPQF